MKICPCCGYFVPESNTLVREGVLLTGRQARIYDLVRRAGDGGIRRDTLLDIIYADAADPPLPNIISVFVRHANRRFEQAGRRVRIRAKRGIDGHYTLQRAR